MKIKLRDEVREFEKGTSTIEIARSISEGLARVAACGKVNGDELIDLVAPINEDCELEIITTKSPEYQELLRHSTAHVLAQAVKTIYPNTKCWVGPATKDGFYYDFDFKTPITSADLAVIEDEMNIIIKANFDIVRREVSRDEAIKMMKKANEPYKVELIEGFDKDEVISTYTQGDYTEICHGPHVKSTGVIKAFKLTKLSGAYLKGDSKNKMLTRIYGVVFEKKSELDEYFRLQEEAMARDHRKIGKDLGIFMFSDLIGKGLPVWLPKGFLLRRQLSDYIMNKELALGYKHVMTPSIGSVGLYKTSGHWDHYKDDMFPSMKVDDEEYVLRPMNCPHHMMIYKYALHSYKDLPIRMAEIANDFRFESSGNLCGIERVRAFTQNDTHIFCRPDQIKAEVEGVIKLILDVYNDFGFKNYKFRLSLRDVNNKEKYFGHNELWEKSEQALRDILNQNKLDYYEAAGEAAFYGPKIDVQVESAIGHDVTLSTIQLDYQLPERFELEYTDENGKKVRPVVIHRAILGSLDRFIAFLLEETKGNLPTWLAPIQVKVISISEKSNAYVNEVAGKFIDDGIRAEIDISDERIGYKIRNAQLEKVPYMIILGENESSEKLVSIRKRNGEEIKGLKYEEALKLISDDIKARNL
ncbi:MAG: threonine--tRNA ligase [Clostridia bacterium]|nr:threonine--tRNA ligase [Clostridia bacterium]